jgi:hypothetical protein
MGLGTTKAVIERFKTILTEVVERERQVNG